MKKCFLLILAAIPLAGFGQGNHRIAVRTRAEVQMIYNTLAQLAADQRQANFAEGARSGETTVFELPDSDDIYNIVIFFDGNPSSPDAIRALLMPGENLDIETGPSGFTIEGSPMMQEVDELRRRVPGMETSALAEFIEQNPASPANVWLFQQISLPFDEMERLYGLLDSGLKNGTYKPAIDHFMAARRAGAEMARQREKVGVGAEAPELALTDSRGEEFRLSALRGRYVVLHFWGAWCGWCTREMPRIREYYQKYGDRAEFVAVNARDDQQTFAQAADEYGIVWTSLRDQDGKAVTELAVGGFPTKIVIDPDGKIIGRYEGAGDELFDMLDETFGGEQEKIENNLQGR